MTPSAAAALLAFVDVHAAARTPVPRLLRHLYPTDDMSVRPEAAAEVAKQITEHVGAVRGPFVYGIGEHLRREVSYITVLHDPTDLVSTVYEQVLSRPEHNLHRMVVDEEVGLEEFVRSDIASTDTRNPQVRRVLGRRSGDPTEVWLEEAKRCLAEEYAVVGVADALPGFLVACQEAFGWDRDALGVVAAPLRKQRARPDVPEAAAKVIAEHNDLDAELYRFAHELQDDRAGRIDGFDQRVQALMSAAPPRPTAGTTRRFARRIRRRIGRIVR